MSTALRRIVAIVLVWLATILAISLGGYFLATSGPFGDMASVSERTGVSVAEVARSRVAKDPAYLREIQRSFEANDRFIYWFFLPMLATIVGAALGWTARGHPRLYVFVGLLPLAGFVLNNDIGSGCLYLAIALLSAWATATWVRRGAPE